MSVWVTTHVWHNSQHRGTALLLMLALADQANDEGISWPSVSTLAHKTRLSDRTVQNLLPVVLESGEVEVVRESTGGHMPRVYRVFAPPPPDHRNYPGRGAKHSPRLNTDSESRGEESAPQEAAGVKVAQSRGEKSAPGVKNSRPGVKNSASRGEARFTQTVFNRVNRQLEPCTEPELPAHAREPRPVDDAFLESLETEFAPALGSREAVKDTLNAALSHKARFKYSDQRAYLRNWLRRDVERMPVRRNGHDPPSTEHQRAREEMARKFGHLLKGTA